MFYGGREGLFLVGLFVVGRGRGDNGFLQPDHVRTREWERVMRGLGCAFSGPARRTRRAERVAQCDGKQTTQTHPRCHPPPSARPHDDALLQGDPRGRLCAAAARQREGVVRDYALRARRHCSQRGCVERLAYVGAGGGEPAPRVARQRGARHCRAVRAARAHLAAATSRRLLPRACDDDCCALRRGAPPDGAGAG